MQLTLHAAHMTPCWYMDCKGDMRLEFTSRSLPTRLVHVAMLRLCWGRCSFNMGLMMTGDMRRQQSEKQLIADDTAWRCGPWRISCSLLCCSQAESQQHDYEHMRDVADLGQLWEAA